MEFEYFYSLENKPNDKNPTFRKKGNVYKITSESNGKIHYIAENGTEPYTHLFYLKNSIIPLIKIKDNKLARTLYKVYKEENGFIYLEATR